MPCYQAPQFLKLLLLISLIWGSIGSLLSQDSLQASIESYTGLVPFKTSTGWGYMTEQQKVIEEPVWDSVALACIQTDTHRAWLMWKEGKVGWVNYDNRCEPKYRSVSIGKSRIPIVEDKSGYFGLYTSDFSTELVSPQYPYMEDMGGFLAVRKQKDGSLGCLRYVKEGNKESISEALACRYIQLADFRFCNRTILAWTSDSSFTYQVSPGMPGLKLTRKDQRKKIENVSFPEEIASEEDEMDISDFWEEGLTWFYRFFDEETKQSFQDAFPSEEAQEQLYEQIKAQPINSSLFDIPVQTYTAQGFSCYRFSWGEHDHQFILIIPSKTKLKRIFSKNNYLMTYNGQTSIFYTNDRVLFPLFTLEKKDKLIDVNCERLLNNQSFFIKRKGQFFLFSMPAGNPQYRSLQPFASPVKRITENPNDDNSVFIHYKKGGVALLGINFFQAVMTTDSFTADMHLQFVWPPSKLGERCMLVAKYDSQGNLEGYFRQDGLWLAVAKAVDK